MIMEKEFKRTETLAIDGKVINVAKIGEKTFAQFNAQLKQNGLDVKPARAQAIYDSLGGGKTDEELIAMYNEVKKGE